MTYKKLQSKTSKQLRTFLYNCRWNKSDVVEFLFYCYSYMDTCSSAAYFNKFTLEQLCDKYHADVVDFVWEEMCGA